MKNCIALLDPDMKGNLSKVFLSLTFLFQGFLLRSQSTLLQKEDLKQIRALYETHHRLYSSNTLILDSATIKGQNEAVPCFTHTFHIVKVLATEQI